MVLSSGAQIELTDIDLVGLALDLLRGRGEALAKLVELHIGDEVGDPLRVWQTLLPLFILLQGVELKLTSSSNC